MGGEGEEVKYSENSGFGSWMDAAAVHLWYKIEEEK